MKWFVVFVILGISLTHAQDNGEKKGVLKRTVRQSIGNMGGAFLAQTEKNVIANCKLNGLTDEKATKLQETYDAMKRCMSSTTLYSVPKNEYIDKVVACSRDAVSETKDCLAASQKYFPEFILDLAKSLINFIYDDKDVLRSYDVPRCMNNLLRTNVQRSYFQCMINVATQTHDDVNIPSSKAEFCGKFLPAVECFPKTLNQFCDKTETTSKFINDYVSSMEHPCETKEK